jgi:hypothetical protein
MDLVLVDVFALVIDVKLPSYRADKQLLPVASRVFRPVAGAVFGILAVASQATYYRCQKICPFAANVLG